MRNISKVYEEGSTRVLAVDSVWLSLKNGEMLLIMGPSGSGKTTLLSMMGCILRPTKCDAVVDVRVVSFPLLTATENVKALLRLKTWDRRRLKDESLNLLKKVGLAQRADFYPREIMLTEKYNVV